MDSRSARPSGLPPRISEALSPRKEYRQHSFQLRLIFSPAAGRGAGERLGHLIVAGSRHAVASPCGGAVISQVAVPFQTEEADQRPEHGLGIDDELFINHRVYLQREQFHGSCPKQHYGVIIFCSRSDIEEAGGRIVERESLHEGAEHAVAWMALRKN